MGSDGPIHVRLPIRHVVAYFITSGLDSELHTSGRKGLPDSVGTKISMEFR